jgi:hypothetical protein
MFRFAQHDSTQLDRFSTGLMEVTVPLLVFGGDQRIHRQHIRQRLAYRQLDPALSKS